MIRRRFIGFATLLGVAGIMGFTIRPKKKSLLHHVFFWLKNPQSEADKQQLISGLKTLSGIPAIRQIHVGVLASTEKREVVDTSWDVSELMFFDDEAGQKIYQDHPIHQDFVKNCSHLWKKVLVYDAIDV
ncbi:Dabb family protein [Flavobacterium sp. DSR3-2]|uniref:Dabb family protein n=1 Tax=Flavobacterium sp. DSR3-2 TaxID=2804634 RepID=UPI003CECE8AB